MGHLRVQAASGGLDPEKLARLRLIETRAEELRGTVEAPTTAVDVQLDLAEYELPKLTESAPRLVKLQKMQRAIEKQ